MKRGLLVIAIFMFFITVANGREMTMPLPAENLTPIEPYECEEGLPPLNSAGSICYPKPGAFIEIYDSLQIELMLLPGSFQAIYIDVEAGTLGYSPPGPIVDDELIPYIQTAPQFLQRQLYLNLSEMDEFSSRAYTEMLDSAHPLWWDELFYCMANLGYEILMDWYRADLLLENVREMYRADSLLDYVEIVDVGSPGEPDHYSFTRYVTTDTGMIGFDTVAIDPDDYYRYVMFPKITDEMPAYINPSTGNTDVSGGHFWRTWFWFVAETTATHSCWALGDSLQSAGSIWKGVHNNDSDNGAVGIITRWIKDCLDFDSGAERPVQPVRIYGLHMGRCGEHEDITCAAARMALIPSNGIESISTDHVWNEFWTGWRWAGWEPVNTYVDNAWVYSDGWGKQFATVFDHRGDGYFVPVTERYSHEIATLELNVRDGSARPVDGARIMLAAEGDGSIYYDCVLYTNSRGKALGKVGDGKHIYWRVDSEIGCNPEPGYVSNCVTNTADGSNYNRSLSVSGHLNWLDWSSSSVTTTPAAYLEASLFPVGEYIKYLGTFEPFDVTYYDYVEGDAYGFEFFVLNDEQYSSFTDGNPFSTLAMLEAADTGYIGIPLDSEPHWLVVGNIGNEANTLVGRLGVTLSDTLSCIGEITKPDTWAISVWPNPFNGACRIAFPPGAQARILDLCGREVAIFTGADYGMNSSKTGTQVWLWQPDASLPSGVYFLNASLGELNITRRLLYLK